MTAGRQVRGALAAVLVAGVLAGCAARLSDSHGYVPTDRDLADIRVGLDTRTTVAALIGQPGVTGIVDDGGWYYVASEFERFLWREPVEVDREVVAISFDQAGIVANVERFGLEDGNVVALSRRVTEDNVRGITFLEQLFRNLGNFSADQFVNNV